MLRVGQVVSRVSRMKEILHLHKCNYSLHMINKEFKITEKPFWKHETCLDVDKTAKLITSGQSLIKKLMQKDSDTVKTYFSYHQTKYLLECICSEDDVKLTYEDVIAYINASFFQKHSCRLFNSGAYQLIVKLQNMHQVTQMIYPNVFAFKCLPVENVDIELVKNLNYRVGKGIVSEAGNLRHAFARPAGFGFWYLQPSRIENNLKLLLEERQLVFRNPDLDFLDAVKYGACFLTNFLYIHPFANGNGRTARLLLSYLLSRYSVVPVSLYTVGFMRGVYLQCLSHAQRFHSFDKMSETDPSDLSRLVLDSVLEEYVEFFRVVFEYAQE